MSYSLWYNAPTMLPASSLEAELTRYRPALQWLHYTTSCNTQSIAPEDGHDHRPKHVELIGIINKPLLLHLNVTEFRNFCDGRPFLLLTPSRLSIDPATLLLMFIF